MTPGPIGARDGGPLIARLWQYQAERFPVAGFIPLIAAFVFSSAAFSRLARGLTSFVEWPRFVAGAYTAIAIFFLLRVLDEHKDQDVDARYRPELPVPRGLVTLGELRLAGASALGLALLLNAVIAPVMLVTMIPIGIWIGLMTKEFFVRDWLRAHPATYLLSHMVVLPVIDIYTTGLDWMAGGVEPPRALFLFLAVTFANGVLLEIGRKVRAPSDEREGVDTYTAVWGRPVAIGGWLVTLAFSVALAVRASLATTSARWPATLLLILAVVASAAAVRFASRPEGQSARMMESASQLWPLATYLLLGGAPFVAQWLGRSV